MKLLACLDEVSVEGFKAKKSLSHISVGLGHDPMEMTPGYVSSRFR